MSQLAYRKHLQRQVVFGARILKQRARRFNFMRCGNRWNVRLRNVRLTSTRSHPDPNVRKHYRLQYNTAYIGRGGSRNLGRGGHRKGVGAGGGCAPPPLPREARKL